MRQRKFTFLLVTLLVASGLLFAGGEASAAFTYNISVAVTTNVTTEATYSYTLNRTGDSTLSYIDFEIPKDIILTPGSNLSPAGNQYFSVSASGATLGTVDIYDTGIGDFGTKFGVGDTRYRVIKVNLTPPTSNASFTVAITLKGQNFSSINKQFATKEQSEFGVILLKAGNGSVTQSYTNAQTPTLVAIPPPTPPLTPVIGSFSVTNPGVAGGQLIFTWTVTNATSGVINTTPIDLTSNTITLPAPPTTGSFPYTITFNNSSGSLQSTASQTTSVQIDPQPPAPLLETTCKQIRKNPTSGNQSCINLCLTTIDGVRQEIASADWYNTPDCTGTAVPLNIYGENTPEKTLVCAPCLHPADPSHPQACATNTDPSVTPFRYVQSGASGNQNKNCDVFQYEQQDQGFAAVLGTDPWIVVNGRQIWVK